MNKQEKIFYFICKNCLKRTEKSELLTICSKCSDGKLGLRFMPTESEYKLIFKAFYKNIKKGRTNDGHVEENLKIKMIPPFDLESETEEIHVEQNGNILIHKKIRIFRKPKISHIRFNDITEIELRHSGGVGMMLSYCYVDLTIITNEGGLHSFAVDNSSLKGSYALLSEDDYTLVFLAEWLSDKTGIKITGDSVFNQYYEMSHSS